VSVATGGSVAGAAAESAAAAAALDSMVSRQRGPYWPLRAGTTRRRCRRQRCRAAGLPKKKCCFLQQLAFFPLS